MTAETSDSGAADDVTRAAVDDARLPDGLVRPRQAESAAELARLSELYELDILDTPREQAFDDLAMLTAQIAGVPVAMVSLIDDRRQWYKATVGVPDDAPTFIDRDVSLCEYVLREQAEIQVSDAHLDVRFAANALVQAHGVSFYAGFPLTTPTGAIVGTLCVLDPRPHRLDERQLMSLRALARQVMSQLQLRHANAEQAREIELRRAAEAALIRSRRDYQLLAEHSSDLVARCRLDGTITHLSSAFTEILGFSAVESIGINVFDTTNPRERGQLEEAFRRVEAGQTAVTTTWATAADGSTRWLEAKYAPVRDPETGELEAHIASRDVTERIEASAALARSEQRFRNVFNGSPVGIALLDEWGVLLSVNPSLCRLVGIAEADLVGQSGRMFGRADDPYPAGGLRALLDASPDNHVQLETRLRRADGEERWGEMNISRVDGPDGESWTLAHVQDVTARKAAEQALTDSETNLAAISRVVRRIRTGEDARESIVHAVVDIGGASVACLLELDDVGDVRITSASDPKLAGQTYALDDAPSTATAWRTGQALFIEQAIGNPLVNQRLLHELGPVTSMLWQPVIADGKVIAVLAVTWSQPVRGLDDRWARAAMLLADEAAVALQHDDLLNRYEALAGTDQLTGLPNRRSWDERLAGLIASARRTKEPFVVAVADVDRFKSYNDTFGHLEGDGLLREIGHAIRQELRAVDVVARWGGEEFAIALPTCDDAEARLVLERIRRAVPRGQTLSIGYTQGDPDATAHSLMSQADAALYDAKRSGRDRIIANLL
jgi:diguanylate cyclase (GGDEF)-like protein/PAS domain S-box-containing protein